MRCGADISPGWRTRWIELTPGPADAEPNLPTQRGTGERVRNVASRLRPQQRATL